MPWLWMLFLIIGAYLVVKLVQGIRDFVAWWVENRELAELRQKSRELHRQGRSSGKPPPLKERSSSITLATKPPAKGSQDMLGNSSRKIAK